MNKLVFALCNYIQYKFWSTYTGLSPSSIIFDDWEVYLSDNKSDVISYFDSSKIDDLWQEIVQKVALKEISWGLPFTSKWLTDAYIWLDNYAQDLIFSLYMALPWRNTRKTLKTLFKFVLIILFVKFKTLNVTLFSYAISLISFKIFFPPCLSLLQCIPLFLIPSF